MANELTDAQKKECAQLRVIYPQAKSWCFLVGNDRQNGFKEPEQAYLAGLNRREELGLSKENYPISVNGLTTPV